MNKTKGFGLIAIVLMSGLVIGGFIGTYLQTLPYCEWLGYGKTFGFASPLVLDLDIINLQFGLSIRFTISGILGMILAVLIYKKF